MYPQDPFTNIKQWCVGFDNIEGFKENIHLDLGAGCQCFILLNFKKACNSLSNVLGKTSLKIAGTVQGVDLRENKGIQDTFSCVLTSA